MLERKVEILYLAGYIRFRKDSRIIRDDFVEPFRDSGDLLVIIPVDLPAILLERILGSLDPFKLGLMGRRFTAPALVAVLTSARVSMEMLDTNDGVGSGRRLHDEIGALLGLDNLTEDLVRHHAPVLTLTAENIQCLLKTLALKTLFNRRINLLLRHTHILCSGHTRLDLRRSFSNHAKALEALCLTELCAETAAHRLAAGLRFGRASWTFV